MPKFRVDKFKRGDRCWVFIDGFGLLASIVLNKIGKAEKEGCRYIYEVMCNFAGEKFITEIEDDCMCSIARELKVSKQHKWTPEDWIESWDNG